MLILLDTFGSLCGYLRQRDFIYSLDFLSPILDAFCVLAFLISGERQNRFHVSLAEPHLDLPVAVQPAPAAPLRLSRRVHRKNERDDEHPNQYDLQKCFVFHNAYLPKSWSERPPLIRRCNTIQVLFALEIHFIADESGRAIESVFERIDG